ncbi:MAG: hypothetical protein KI785_02805 [Devosiaceae bacterium]|nr:hypothetical protein [Devosiaceae bacterium MH13]
MAFVAANSKTQSEKVGSDGPASFAVWIGTTLAVAALIHLLVVFALPRIGSAVQVETLLPAGETEPQLYPDPTGEITARFRFADARQDSAYCAFDLRDGAVRVGGEIEAPFWSISVHTLSGLVVGSVNHRAASGGRLDLVVMRPELATELTENGAVLPPDTLVVEMDGPLGLARISGLATHSALRPTLREELAQTDCTLATFTFVAPTPDDAEDGDAAPDRQAPRQRNIPAPVPRPILETAPTTNQ